MLRLTRKAQVIAEYVLLVAVISAVFVGIYHWGKSAVDQIIDMVQQER